MDAGSGSKSYISWQQRAQRGRCIIMVATACARWGAFHLWNQTSLDLKKSAVSLKGLKKKKSVLIFFKEILNKYKTIKLRFYFWLKVMMENTHMHTYPHSFFPSSCSCPVHGDVIYHGSVPVSKFSERSDHPIPRLTLHYPDGFWSSAVPHLIPQIVAAAPLLSRPALFFPFLAPHFSGLFSIVFL